MRPCRIIVVVNRTGDATGDSQSLFYTRFVASKASAPKTAKLFATTFWPARKAKSRSLIRLLTHIPSGVIDRRNMPEIAFAAEGAIVTLKVRVDRHQPSPQGRPNVPHRVFCHDETGEIGLVYFRAKSAWLEKLFPVGETVLVSGKMEWFNGRPTMVHPDQVMSLADSTSSRWSNRSIRSPAGLGQRSVVQGHPCRA